jgi:hypothetical protein
VGGEEDVQQGIKINYLVIIGDFDHLRIAGIASADHTVVWVGHIAVGIAALDIQYPLESLKYRFGTPEASAPNDEFFDRHFFSFLWISLKRFSANATKEHSTKRNLPPWLRIRSDHSGFEAINDKQLSLI